MKASLRLLLAMAMLVIAILGSAGTAAAASKATYYLSLGDSAAEGLQPIGYGENHGYADQLFDLVRSEFTQLRLVKLGCSAETTDSLISGTGSLCYLTGSSQLDAATTFLRTHPGQIGFITIDIGANDAVFVGGCWDPATGVLDLACVQSKLSDIQSNLAYIIETLKAAAPGVPIYR